MFRFRGVKDKTKILAGEPWHFDHHVLVLRSVEGQEQPSNIFLFVTPFWVQIHGLPFNYRDSKIAMMIGKKLGVLMEVYQEEDWDMLSIMRVRVGLNLRNPLRTTLPVAAEEEEAFVVSFRYEQLPTFCFLCRRLGHGMKDCGYKSDEEIHDEGSLSYTEELRAPPFRKNFFF
ncbi:hypothetical protein Tsubulata_042990 [Turnera subulata]|uniref:Zinc knuckle CX2CX4HX4C domain-containing protein n=1 Tax=Turnera subulata TaxID=218843 RepID=A0A9Q0GGC5_9ROSI|nr:hypothetical protein Tsubulata_042990 [Turnera subulata]